MHADSVNGSGSADVMPFWRFVGTMACPLTKYVHACSEGMLVLAGAPELG